MPHYLADKGSGVQIPSAPLCETVKELDRGTLAKVLAGLGHDEAWQMVRVPAAEATRVEAVLRLSRYLHGFLAEREYELAKRQRMLDVRDEIREQRLRTVPQTQPTPVVPTSEIVKVGRNDPCPCGAGMKYKRCRGG